MGINYLGGFVHLQFGAIFLLSRVLTAPDSNQLSAGALSEDYEVLRGSEHAHMSQNSWEKGYQEIV